MAHWLIPFTYNVPPSFAVTVKLAEAIALRVYCEFKLVGLNVNVGAVVSHAATFIKLCEA
jgi:hypothetical protein